MHRCPGYTATPHFDGVSFDPERDGKRLANQLEQVRQIMLDGQWHTLTELATLVCGSEASVSARLRDLRKPRFGSLSVERRRIIGGLWEYRVLSA